ncbi:kinase-like protein [Cylindrobasidium torrendii FP15055 ss-10]|uniref:Kinase-like protein n=1 Tax=Cylindrobasidium torrendii FP15055 ss-10 TaxID=1314674 RepID=A0A0D7BI32_9AGAR|nr:kinase-like protein [Cylindrobasidium torrendii FP15055 ss-10]
MSFPPKAPSDLLRLNSYRIINQLALIEELAPWTDTATITVNGAYRALWTILAKGAPLCALLNMLGPPYVDSEDGNTPGRDFVQIFVDRLRDYEDRKVVGMGELVQVDDIFGGTAAGYARMLKAVERVLVALEGVYPDLYSLPSNAERERMKLVKSLVDSEEVHTELLSMVAESAHILTAANEPRIECLLVHRTHLKQYHNQVLLELRRAATAPWSESWTKVFATNDPAFVTRIVSAYRSICVHYLPIRDFLEDQLATLDADLRVHARTLLDIIGRIPVRLFECCDILRSILHVSTPTSHTSYAGLCQVIVQIQDATDTLDEMSYQVRGMRATKILDLRADGWGLSMDPGPLILDDILHIHGLNHSFCVLLFDDALLCCTNLEEYQHARYPIYSWELGPALRSSSKLPLSQVVRRAALTRMVVFDEEGFDLVWMDAQGEEHAIPFVCTSPGQLDQWRSTLSSFLPVVDSETQTNVLHIPSARPRRRSRPWSVRGNKSVSSLVPDLFAPEITSSPAMLPASLDTGVPALSLNSQPPQPCTSVPTSPPPLNAETIQHEGSTITDLTGHVLKKGHYPLTGGGYSDVWKGIWVDGSQQKHVAIKVIRSDSKSNDRLQTCLARELAVWRDMAHPHVLPLLGVVTDFGPHMSMVCPWMENGSVTRYLERCGDLVGMVERMGLVSQVAEGLAYLHARGVVHGDLTGANVLVNDQHEAVLCDFGLSMMVAELSEGKDGQSQGSVVGGAVRWADARLYQQSRDASMDSGIDVSGDVSGDGDEPDVVMAAPSMASDIYSFGSVMLEILSGRIPYHYVRSDAQVIIEVYLGRKPRRPSRTFVNEKQWEFIQTCWDEDVERRPEVGDVVLAVAEMLRELKGGKQ